MSFESLQQHSLPVLLVRRAQLVHAAAAWKHDADGVRAESRVVAVVANVRGAAANAGLSEDDVERRYRRLIELYTAWEMASFETNTATLMGGAIALSSSAAGAQMCLADLRAHINLLDVSIVTMLATSRPDDPQVFPSDIDDLQRRLVVDALAILLAPSPSRAPRAKRTIAWLWARRELVLACILGITMALALRFQAFPFQSRDYELYLEPWYDFIRDHGGWPALKYAFSNYSPAYLYLLVVATWLPFEKIVAIKIVSVVFDFLLAIMVSRLVATVDRRSSVAPMAGFLATLFAPTVLLNSSVWGQCDAIYATFVLASLWLVQRDRGVLAALAFGVAFSVKLQAVFVLPLMLLLAAKRRVPWPALLLSPAIYLVFAIPSWLLGRPLKDFLIIYTEQTNSYSRLTLGAPNLYQWVPSGHKHLFLGFVIVLGLCVLVLVVRAALRSKSEVTPDFVVTLGLASAILFPFFLPRMHERYFFVADVLSIPYAFAFPRRFWVPIAVIGASAFSYLPYLSFGEWLCPAFLAFAMFAALVAVLNDSWRLLLPRREPLS